MPNVSADRRPQVEAFRLHVTEGGLGPLLHGTARDSTPAYGKLCRHMHRQFDRIQSRLDTTDSLLERLETRLDS